MHDLEFKIAPSHQHLAFLTAMLLGAAIIVLSLSIPVWLKLLGALLWLGYGGRLIWQIGLLKGRQSVISMRLLHDGKWLVQTNQAQYKAELRGDSTVTGWVSVLRFRLPRQPMPISCVLFRDSLGLDDYRKMMVVTRIR